LPPGLGVQGFGLGMTKSENLRIGPSRSRAPSIALDAVIGRYVLMFQADPVAMLRGVARHLRPGGTIVFHEPVGTAVDPARRRRHTTTAVDGSSRRSGAAVSRPMGIKLDAAFREAGLTAPSMHLEAVVGGTEGGVDW
jgi:hypothetical protein